MKKIVFALMGLFLLVGCSSPLGGFNMSNASYITTNNGTLLLLENKTLQSLCNKDQLDKLMKDISPDNIAKEFNITDYKKNVDQSIYKTSDGYPDSCQYTLKHTEFITKNNYVVLADLNLKKGDEVKPLDLLAQGKFKDFFDKPNFEVVGSTVQLFLKQKLLTPNTVNVFSSDKFSVTEGGKYELYAYPVFANYQFIDKKAIYDYEFPAVVGISFALNKVS